ncbi:GH92 family glycosyl hydrolase [Capnocytophaga canimorsus]|uniref:GH92 family glycosyl hydrolase n=1 Tax=Capnocytophaga canimorsus TaxID=28188 RepID=UPI001EDF9996|nr:GH92 family glycosyl hydrolase [Capnocytophaga canimorsus]GJQ05400.1 alpha-1 2-mannosidase [Capnocytophaga canimorsus]
MRILFVYFALSFLIIGCQTNTKKAKESDRLLTDYVNPLMGTDSTFELSNGNTYPAIALPWGMHFWTPQTNKMGDGWAYQYHANKIRGFKQTHQPSPWINDYGAFAIMPVTGPLKIKEDERASWFSHKAEVVKPHYYKVYLADYDTTVEITPTDRAAQFRFTFPQTQEAHILIDAFFKGSMVKIIPQERKIIGFARNHNSGVPENFHNYFVIQFDKDFKTYGTWSDNWLWTALNTQSEGQHVGATLSFSTEKGEKVTAKVASSFISIEQAELNLRNEIGNDTFEQTQHKALNTWEKELSRIQIEDYNTQNIQTFYSCLYRVLLFPRKFYEINADGEIVHYSPYNGEILSGYMFTDNGFWDTFRAVFPFFNLMYPEMNRQFMKGLVNTYLESGWLPEWASPGHRDCMIGSNSAPIIADAYLKGNIEAKDAEILLEAMLKNATQNVGRPVKSVGREGVDYYNELGYVPYDVGINENAARTLEYAYADFAIYKMAKKMGKTQIAETYKQKAFNYKHLFDPQSGWMRGKNKAGDFQSPFNPLKWGDAFTEGNSLHYTWSVFQDIEGLTTLMGGDEKFAQKLDEVFEMPPLFDDSYYGFTIHEIREMQIMDMGNYAHGNQPIQHIIYLYNYVGKPHKTQEKVREVLTKLYAPTPDGYCGDEDNGQTSAWYVFSALGFYPVTPVTDQYVLGAPLFEKATLKMPSGKTFTIKGKQNSQNNKYVKSITLKGKNWNKPYLRFNDVQSGGLLIFEMDDKPSKSGQKGEKPYSLSTE